MQKRVTIPRNLYADNCRSAKAGMIAATGDGFITRLDGRQRPSGSITAANVVGAIEE